jgi:hypothetical protein
MPTTTLYLPRPGFTKKVSVDWNGDIEQAGTKARVPPKRRYLWEMDDDERAERLVELGAYHAE